MERAALTTILTALATNPVLWLALWSSLPIVIGSLLRRPLPLLGGTLRVIGQLGLLVAMVLGAVLWLHLPAGLPGGADDAPVPAITGTDTRVAMADDGHFWVQARANHVARRFLVDTGATLTTLSARTASELGAAPVGGQVLLTTANGTTRAELGRIARLRVGNVVARDLPIAVAPGMADTNVLGMNFLSQLASWRVEGRTLILVPHHPQPTA